MEHATKLALVEPRMLDELQTHMEYKNLLKPAHNKRKADLSIELHNVLNDAETSDDVKTKTKLYQQTFRRLRNMNNNISKPDKSIIKPISIPLARRHRCGQQQTPTPVAASLARRGQQQHTPTPRSNRKRRKTQQWSPL